MHTTSHRYGRVYKHVHMWVLTSMHTCVFVVHAGCEERASAATRKGGRRETRGAGRQKQANVCDNAMKSGDKRADITTRVVCPCQLNVDAVTWLDEAKPKLFLVASLDSQPLAAFLPSWLRPTTSDH